MTLSRRWVRGAVWVVLLIVGSVLARAQEVSGSISGTVLDPTGASVNGAVVTITNTDRAHVERVVKTDKAGFYTATSLPLGNYSVSIEMKVGAPLKWFCITSLMFMRGILRTSSRR